MIRNWDCLKYFIAVGRSGTLSGAASSLDSNPATIGRYIAQLEEDLGYSLFLKHARGYSLTDEGQKLFSQMEPMAQAVHSAGHSPRSDSLEGEIKLAVPESVAHYILLPRLQHFQAANPKLSIEMLVSRQIADLARREADLAVRIVEPHQRDFSADYIAKQVGEFRFGLYVNSAVYKKLGKNAKGWKSLPHVSWDTTWIKLPMVEWLKEIFPQSRPILRSNSMQAHVQAVKGGEVLAMLPRYIGQADRELCEIDFPLSHTRHELWLFYHHDLRGSLRVKALADFIDESCRLG